MYGGSVGGGCGGTSLGAGLLLSRVEGEIGGEAGPEMTWLLRAKGLLTQRLTDDYYLTSQILYSRFRAHPEEWPLEGQSFETRWFLGDAVILHFLGETVLLGGGLRYMSYTSPTVLWGVDAEGNLTGPVTPHGVVPWRRFAVTFQGADPTRVGYGEDGPLVGYDWDVDVGMAVAEEGGGSRKGLTALLGGEVFVGYQQEHFILRAGLRAMYIFVSANYNEQAQLFARDLFIGPTAQLRATF